MFKYIRYSGAVLSLSLNPIYWKILPYAHRVDDGWAGPNERTWSFGFLMLKVTVWFDNGDW